MDRKNIFTNIRNKFEHSVIGPVNPFTIDNPDVLLYNNHQLIGLYIPLVKEVQNPDILLRRLHMSRLALSGSISSVLLLPENALAQLFNNEVIQGSFDRVHCFDGNADLMDYISCDIKSTHYVDKRLRSEVMKRFWGAMGYVDRYSYIRGDYKNIKCSSEVQVRRWSRPRNILSSTHTSYNDSCLITSKGRTKQSFKEAYENIMSFATMYNYSLSDGNLKRTSSVNDIFMYLNIEDLDIILNKEINLRTMLFLGYLPCTIGSLDEIKCLNDHYYSFRKESKYL